MLEKGTWKDNNMHGKGIYTWSDGRIYEGEYLNDKKHGFGIYKWYYRINVSFLGMMGESMRANGETGNSTAKANTS